MTSSTRPAIGILSIGDMGMGIAKLLVSEGYTVFTNCEGRSQDTIDRATAAKIIDTQSDTKLVQDCDLILSVAPPRDAAEILARVKSAHVSLISTQDEADGDKKENKKLYFADMNAIAPSTVKAMAASVSDLPNFIFIDASIIGGPPSLKSLPTATTTTTAQPSFTVPLIPTSGPTPLSNLSPSLATLLHTRHISPKIGAASGLKMCFASLTKGFTAIATQAYTTAHNMGVLDELRTTLGEMMSAERVSGLEKGMVGMPPKAYRWVREMEEIGRTVREEGGFKFGAGAGAGEESGVVGMFEGAAEVYRAVADESVLGEEKIGARKRGRTAEDVAVALSEGLEKRRRRE